MSKKEKLQLIVNLVGKLDSLQQEVLNKETHVRFQMLEDIAEEAEELIEMIPEEEEKEVVSKQEKLKLISSIAKELEVLQSEYLSSNKSSQRCIILKGMIAEAEEMLNIRKIALKKVKETLTKEELLSLGL